MPFTTQEKYGVITSYSIHYTKLYESFQAIKGGVNVVKGLRLLVTVVDVGVTAGDLTVIFAEDKINSLPGVAEFIDSWNTFSSYIGFLSFGADNLVNGINKAPDVATSVTNKYRQFQKTYKDNPAKLVEVIGEANLQKVEKIVDDLEAAVITSYSIHYTKLYDFKLQIGLLTCKHFNCTTFYLCF